MGFGGFAILFFRPAHIEYLDTTHQIYTRFVRRPKSERFVPTHRFRAASSSGRHNRSLLIGRVIPLLGTQKNKSLSPHEIPKSTVSSLALLHQDKSFYSRGEAVSRSKNIVVVRKGSINGCKMAKRAQSDKFDL